MAAKAKTTGNIDVPNLQESLVDVHVHGDTKRKAALPARPGKGKDLKKVRVTLLGPRSSSGTKGPESGLIELPETSVRKDIDINLPEIVINSIESMEPDHLVKYGGIWKQGVDSKSSGWIFVSTRSKGGKSGKGGGVAWESC